jgi:hypothetical protein
MNSPIDARTYVGRLEAGSQAVYVVDACGVERLRARESFCWGSDALGRAAELAHVMLSDASGAEPGPDTRDRFAAQILSRLPHDGFTLQRDTVSAWLRRAVTV